MVEIGDWCITKDKDWEDGPGMYGIYADHIKGCEGSGGKIGRKPIELGDCCWDAGDKDATCFYCDKPVPPEIQALVHLQTTL